MASVSLGYTRSSDWALFVTVSCEKVFGKIGKVSPLHW